VPDNWGDSDDLMDVEVVYSIGKYLTKLSSLITRINSVINVDGISMTEEMKNMIGKKLPQLS
jgi:hypothetical protein